MKILVTGNLGYIGSVLTEVLADAGHNIFGIDCGYFIDCLLSKPVTLKNQLIKDIRDLSLDDVSGAEVVIHLAGLSNDPLGEITPGLTEEINLKATLRLAEICKKVGVKRFIYASSQSMYGVSESEDELDEDASEKNPITAYARTKWDAELGLMKLQSESFVVCALRPSTVFGVSPRLRTDIVFNNFVACAYTTNRIEIKSDGTPWRPVVHVRDVSNAFLAAINAPLGMVAGRAFNVGIPNGNFTVRDLASAAHLAIPGSELIFTGEHGKDSRTYKVSFKRILEELKSYYAPSWGLQSGAKELVDYFKRVNFNEEKFRGETTNRLKRLEKMKKEGLVNFELRRTDI